MLHRDLQSRSHRVTCSSALRLPRRYLKMKSIGSPLRLRVNGGCRGSLARYGVDKHAKTCGQPGGTRGTIIAAALPSLGHTLKGCLSNGVLEATAGTTFKLFLVCGLIGYLLASGRLSEDTAPVLSKVAFNIMLPCMLFTKVAATLATNFQCSMFVVPVLALFQIAVGAMGGEIASRIIDPDKAHIIGWHPLNPAKSANAIAMSTAAAVGIPQAPSVFLPRPGSPPQGTRELIKACCCFGNSFTLPLVFMMSLLPAAAFDRATGYTALFLASWSPCLWSYGFQLLSSAAIPTKEDQQGPLQSFDEADLNTAEMALLANPDEQEPKTEGAALLGRLALQRRLSSIKRWLMKTFNPPLLAILAGVALGLSPAGRPLFCPSAPNNLPIELGACLGLGKLVIEMLQLLAGGSLALQSTILAASLFQSIPDEEEEEGERMSPSAPQEALLALPDGQGSVASSWTRPNAFGTSLLQNSLIPKEQGGSKARAALGLKPAPAKRQKRNGPPTKPVQQNLLAMLMPKTGLEWKVVGAISLVRFGLVPVATLAAVTACAQFLPADNVCILALLIQGCMPPAQNLALVVNLRKNTQFLAPRLAKLLLRLYFIAVIPVTLWVTVYVSRIPVPLANL